MIGGPAQIEIVKGGPSAQVVLELGSSSLALMSLQSGPEGALDCRLVGGQHWC